MVLGNYHDKNRSEFRQTLAFSPLVVEVMRGSAGNAGNALQMLEFHPLPFNSN